MQVKSGNNIKVINLLKGKISAFITPRGPRGLISSARKDVTSP